MHTSSLIAAATWLLSSASAAPNLNPRQTDTALQPWVTVNEDGKPSTVTPVLSTIDGSPTILSGAPNDLTATVFTRTSMGEVTTSTGTAPLPTATNANEGSGAFEACNNTDGDMAPWCSPIEGTTLYPGTTYYFTWAADYFTERNTTVMIQGNYFNETTGEYDDQAFESHTVAASWGFWSYTVEDKLLRYQPSQNVTFQLATLAVGSKKSEILKGPKVLISRVPGYTPDTGKGIDGRALYIALPTVLGFVVVCVVGTCIWNRNARKITLGNVMSRNRHGYGVGKSSRSRMGLGKREKANERIQLMEQEVEADGGQVYRDAPPRPRRDSGDLGSLAGTPTEDRRMDFHRPGAGNGNAYRDGDRF